VREVVLTCVTQRKASLPLVQYESLRKTLVLLIKGEIELQHHVQGYTSDGQ
jgi:hypothetical protein